MKICKEIAEKTKAEFEDHDIKHQIYEDDVNKINHDNIALNKFEKENESSKRIDLPYSSNKNIKTISFIDSPENKNLKNKENDLKKSINNDYTNL